MVESRTRLLTALAFVLCLVAGSTPRVVGDGGEYLAQALNFAALNPPSLGRQDIPVIQSRVAAVAPVLADWSIEDASVAGPDRRRDFLHFWFYALLATPLVAVAEAVGISPVHGFTTLNVILLALALHLAMSRVAAPIVVLLFASPLVWWIDKPHTEIFTIALLTVVMLTMHDRPWWALVAAGAAATQNPPITIVVLLVGLVVLWERGLTAISDRRVIAGAAAGLALAALQPLYTYLRHDTPSLLLYATRAGTPTMAELAASVFDPSMGLVGNFPIFLIGTIGAAAWLVIRHPRHLASAPVAAAAIAAAVFLYSFAQTSNSHHGATPSLTRYALWFIPLALAIWLPWWNATGPRAHRAVTAAATLSAIVSVFAFHPAVGQNSREPTWLASWLWTKHPGWNNPLPEVFSETMLGVEGTTVPAATIGCEKILVAPGTAGEPAWPVPCLPAPVPAECIGPDVFCYANRRGDTYDFVVAPGRELAPRRDTRRAWPVDAEPHVRRVYLESGWADLAADTEALTVLRAQHDVRVAPVGRDSRFLLVLQPSGPSPEMHIRSALPLRGTIVDAATGAVLMPLAHDGPADELWTLALPPNDGNLMLLTMHQLPAATAP